MNIRASALVLPFVLACGGSSGSGVVEPPINAPVDPPVTDSPAAQTPADPPPAVVDTPASYTWGYIGCSNTHDTINGYHAAQSSKHVFWKTEAPTGGYPIEGHTVAKWADANDPIWAAFDRMKQAFNGGNDPPVIWIQLCENLNPSESNYHVTTQEELATMITNVKAHASTSMLYISPLQAYAPITLCPKMGQNGEAIARLTGFGNTVVDHGAAKAGPGTKGLTNLGPLTADTVFTDDCHPSGPMHGSQMAGSGELMLGTSLASFFDALSGT